MRRRRDPCSAGWRVRWTARFRVEAKRLGIWESVRRELRDLERRLRDPQLRDKTLQMLHSQPVIGYVYIRKLGARYPLRRYYFGRQTARGFFVILEQLCRVWFVDLLPRTNGTYKRKTHRL